MNDQPNHNRQIIATLTVLIVITIIVAWAMIAKQDDDSTDSASTQTTSSSSSSNSSNSDSSGETNGEYTDGTYSATGSYSSPGGTEEITISVTLEDGVITATTAESGANNSDSASHQADFIAAYKSLIVGKDIDDVSLSRVAGSSLTPIGFNSAIQQIKDEAQS